MNIKNHFTSLKKAMKRAIAAGLIAVGVSLGVSAHAQNLALRPVITATNTPVTGILPQTITNLVSTNYASYNYPIGDKPGVISRPDLSKGMLYQLNGMFGTNAGSFALGFTPTLDGYRYSTVTNWVTNSFTAITNVEQTLVGRMAATNFVPSPKTKLVAIANLGSVGVFNVTNLTLTPEP